jgi:hypothetical protein
VTTPCICGGEWPHGPRYIWVPSRRDTVTVPGCVWCRDAVCAGYFFADSWPALHRAMTDEDAYYE